MRKSEHPGFVFEGQITKEQLAFFDKNGFIKFRNFISPETVNLFMERSRGSKSAFVRGVNMLTGSH
jgi:hypothetical protein